MLRANQIARIASDFKVDVINTKTTLGRRSGGEEEEWEDL